MIKVLIVDDTLLYRHILKEIFSELEGIEVVGYAVDGLNAVQKFKDLQPDLVTLDVEMPKMNGIEALKKIKEIDKQAAVLMISSLTKRGAEQTIECLRLGALDFLEKPTCDNPQQNIDQLREQVYSKIKAVDKFFNQKSETSCVVKSKIGFKNVDFSKHRNIRLIAVGVSTGGPQTLVDIFKYFPESSFVSLVIVQHMPESFISSLAESLQRNTAIEVRVISTGEVVEPGKIYIAPGNKQTKVIIENNKNIFSVTDDPPENFCKPAVDYLFRSIAIHYQKRSLGIILTGMGVDGKAGIIEMKKNDAMIVSQDKESCVVFGMPSAAYDSGCVDCVLSKDEIGKLIAKVMTRDY